MTNRPVGLTEHPVVSWLPDRGTHEQAQQFRGHWIWFVAPDRAVLGHRGERIESGLVVRHGEGGAVTGTQCGANAVRRGFLR